MWSADAGVQPQTELAPPRAEPGPGLGVASRRRVHRPRRRPAPLRAAVRRPATRRAVAAVADEVRWELLPLASVTDHLDHLPAGARVTVTCSPKRGVDHTVDVAVQLAGRGFAAVPHLSARQVASHAHLGELCDRLLAAGIDDVFVVGGDAPEPAGPFPDGLALLEAMAHAGYCFPRVGVPGYPEGHHHVAEAALWAALAAKQPHATYVVTQMCFASELICRWIAAARARGITLPVYAGVPGVVDPATLLGVSARIGIGDSLRFVRRNRHTLRRLLRPGGYRPDALLRGLGAKVRAGRCEVAGLHVYTFNRVPRTVGHLEALRRRAGEAAPLH